MSDSAAGLRYEDVNAFLWCCYLPRPSTLLLQPLLDDLGGFQASQRRMSTMSERQLVRMGESVLKQVFEAALASARGTLIVPLSGGLDSRLVLAHIVEAGLGPQTIAVSYGIPGALDFEIPKVVAKKAGVRHECVDLSNVEVSQPNLENVAASGGAWTNLISTFYNYLIPEQFGIDHEYWYGFLGDPLAGSHFHPSFCNLRYSAAKRIFAEFNRWNRSNGINLADAKFSLEDVLPAEPIISDSTILSYPEQLDFAIRQASWILRGVVNPSVKARLPYSAPEWVRYTLALPSSGRRDCAIYRRIMLKRFPTLFAIRTKSVRSGYIERNAIGMAKVFAERALLSVARRSGRHLASRTTKYLDFDSAYRTRADLRALADMAACRLESRGIAPWLRPREIIRSHMACEIHAARAIDTLISLEIALAANSSRPCVSSPA